MTRAVATDLGYFPFYIGREGKWVAARDARGALIECATEALALSVARYRRRRLKIWR
jgi:hypothetical protein